MRKNKQFPTPQEIEKKPELLYSDHSPVMYRLPVAGETDLKILSWNILGFSTGQNGFSGRNDWENKEEGEARYRRIIEALQRFIDKQNPHVITLQEASPAMFDALLKEMLPGWTFQPDEKNPEMKILYRKDDDNFKPVENTYKLDSPFFLNGFSRISMLPNNEIIPGTGEYNDTQVIYLKRIENQLTAYRYDVNKKKYISHNIVESEEVIKLMAKKEEIFRSQEFGLFSDIMSLCGFTTLNEKDMGACQQQLFDYKGKKIRVRNVHTKFHETPEYHEELYLQWLSEEDENIVPVIVGDTNMHVAPEEETLQNIETGLVPLSQTGGATETDFPDGAFTRNIQKEVEQLKRTVLDPYPEAQGDILLDQPNKLYDRPSKHHLLPCVTDVSRKKHEPFFLLEDALKKQYGDNFIKIRPTAKDNNRRGMALTCAKEGELYKLIEQYVCDNHKSDDFQFSSIDINGTSSGYIIVEDRAEWQKLCDFLRMELSESKGNLLTQDQRAIVDRLKTKNFNFIPLMPTSDKIEGLNNKVAMYDKARANLFYKLQNTTLSQTALMLEKYHFFKNNRGLLIDIQRLAAQQKLATDMPDKEVKRIAQKIYQQTQIALKNGKRFCEWAESLLPSPSLNNETHVLSRDISEEKKSLATKENKPIKKTVEMDKKCELEQVGVELLPEFQAERLDPQHRALGVMFNRSKNLSGVYGQWSARDDKPEDFTVDIAFNNINPQITYLDSKFKDDDVNDNNIYLSWYKSDSWAVHYKTKTLGGEQISQKLDGKDINGVPIISQQELNILKEAVMKNKLQNISRDLQEKIIQLTTQRGHTPDIQLDTSVFTKYFTYEESLCYLASTNDQNQLCFSDQKPITTFEKDFIYVMDMHGNLFIHEDNLYMDEKGALYRLEDNKVYINIHNRNERIAANARSHSDMKRIAHSSFARGEAVACAGGIKMVNGKITHINNLSGHYKPGPYTLHRAVTELKKRNVLADNCTIFDSDAENGFSFKEENKLRKKLSYEKYNELYEKNSQSLKIEAKQPEKTIDLKEKHNPKKLLDCLSRINYYLKKRAKETSKILTTLFHSYHGGDYFERRESFTAILSKLKEKDIKGAIELIDEHSPRFEKGFWSRNGYVNLLKELKNALLEIGHNENFNNIALYAHDKIAAYHTLYSGMQRRKEARVNYQKNHYLFVTNRLDKKPNSSQVALAQIDYKYQRQSMPENVRAEFYKAKELEDIETLNLNNTM